MADEVFYEAILEVEELFEKEYMSVREVAELLRFSERQVYRLIRRGELVREKKGIPSWSVYALLKRGYEEIYCE